MLTIVSILMYVAINAQSITPYVVNSTGGSFSNGSGTIEFNVGEVTTSTLQNGQFITQGFLQANPNILGIDIIQFNKLKISVFPNPGNGIFQLSGLESGRVYGIRIFDITGQIILEKQTSNNESIDISRAEASIYFVVLTDTTLQTNIIFKISKI